MCLDFILLARSIIEDFGRTALMCKFLELFKNVVNSKLDISGGFGELDGVLMYFAETGDGNKIFADAKMRYLVLKARLGELPFQFWRQYFLTSALFHLNNFHNDLQNSAFFSELEGLTLKDAELGASELKEISQLELVEVTTMVKHFCYVCGVDESVHDNITHRLTLSCYQDQLENWLTTRARQDIKDNNVLEEESTSLGDELLASSTRRLKSFQDLFELAARARLVLTNKK